MVERAETGRATSWNLSGLRIGSQPCNRVTVGSPEPTKENAARPSPIANATLVVQCAVIGDVPSGGDRLILELVRRLPAEFGEVTFLTTPEGASQLRQSGISNAKLALVPSFRLLGGSSSPVLALAYVLRGVAAAKAAYSLVRNVRKASMMPVAVSTSSFVPDLLGVLAARAAGARWVQSWQLVIPSPWVGFALRPAKSGSDATVHLNMSLRTRIRSGLSYVSERLTLMAARRWSERLMVPTAAMASDATAMGFLPRQVMVVSYGIDLKEVRSAISGLTNDAAQYDAIFVGRFHQQKGLEDLLAAWTLIRAEKPCAKLAVVGGGSGPAALRFRSELGRSRGAGVISLGILTGYEKFQALARAKVFIFPSHHESWGHVVLEAMAVGLPVVGYDIPSSREVFGDAMVRVPLGDTPALAAAVLRLLDDSDSRERFSGRGRHLADGKDWNCTAQTFFRSLAS